MSEKSGEGQHSKEVVLCLVGRGATNLWEALQEIQKPEIKSIWTGKDYASTYEFLIRNVAYADNAAYAEAEQETVIKVLKYMVSQAENHYFLSLIRIKHIAPHVDFDTLLEAAVNAWNGKAASVLIGEKTRKLPSLLCRMHTAPTVLYWKTGSFSETYAKALKTMVRQIGCEEIDVDVESDLDYLPLAVAPESSVYSEDDKDMIVHVPSSESKISEKQLPKPLEEAEAHSLLKLLNYMILKFEESSIVCILEVKNIQAILNLLNKEALQRTLGFNSLLIQAICAGNGSAACKLVRFEQGKKYLMHYLLCNLLPLD